MSGRDSFDCTPQQYHGGLDKLWEALGLTEVQDEDVFTLSARRMKQLQAENEQLLTEISRLRMKCGPDEMTEGEYYTLAALEAENERLRSALQAIIDRDPSRPGPRAAVVVTTDTLVEIAMEALGGGE